MHRIVRTDDAAKRAEFVWLGPVKTPWPFHARGTAWVLALVLCPITIVGAYALVPVWVVAPGPVGVILHLALSVILGLAAGVWAVRLVGKQLSPTRPLRHHAAMIMAERHAPRTPTATTYALVFTGHSIASADDPTPPAPWWQRNTLMRRRHSP